MMSNDTQPPTPGGIPDDLPVKLTPDQIAALSDKLQEWLVSVTPNGTPPGQLRLCKDSAYEVQEAVQNFLNIIQFQATLSEALIRHF